MFEFNVDCFRIGLMRGFCRRFCQFSRCYLCASIWPVRDFKRNDKIPDYMVGSGTTNCERRLLPGTCLGQDEAKRVFGVTSTGSLWYVDKHKANACSKCTRGLTRQSELCHL